MTYMHSLVSFVPAGHRTLPQMMPNQLKAVLLCLLGWSAEKCLRQLNLSTPKFKFIYKICPDGGKVVEVHKNVGGGGYHSVPRGPFPPESIHGFRQMSLIFSSMAFKARSG